MTPDKIKTSTSSRGGFFSWLLGDEQETPQEAADKAQAEKVGYPALSSVPNTPSDFSAVRSTESQKKEELQDEHMMAQHEKQNLGNEPSQEAASPVAPVTAAPQPAEQVMQQIMTPAQPEAFPSATQTATADSPPIRRWNPETAKQ